jgi:hypothetical protein
MAVFYGRAGRLVAQKRLLPVRAVLKIDRPQLQRPASWAHDTETETETQHWTHSTVRPEDLGTCYYWLI